MWVFFGFLYLYRKKVIWIVGLDLGCVIGKSVDFSGVLRYWGRYWNLGWMVWKVWILLGLVGFWLVILIFVHIYFLVGV